MDIGSLGGSETLAYGINSVGHIVGQGTTTMDESRAFFWSPSMGMVSMFGSVDSASAVDLNDVGVATGWFFETPIAPGKSFLWSLGTGKMDIGEMFARALNNQNHVVGERPTLGASIYYGTGSVHNLNGLLDASGSGWFLQNATDINDSGQIVGVGTYNGETRAFLLNPVPEPATIAALGLGLALLARRRKHAACCG